MKTKLILLMLLITVMTNPINAQIRMDCDGKVKIGHYEGDPREKLDVDCDTYFSCRPANSGFYVSSYYTDPIIYPQMNHSLYLGRFDRELWRIYTEYIRVKGVWLSSDEKIKENIRPLSGSLNNLLQLKAVKFDFKAELYADSLDFMKDVLIAKRKDHSGFLAQEVQGIFPKLVEYNEEADLLEINYLGFIPELVEAIKEQQTIINNLIFEISELKSESSDNLKSALISTETNEIKNDKNLALYQNSPNPFSENTRIEYYLPEDVKSATIYIYDMNGTQLKGINLHQKGYGNITIDGGELKAGMYLYTLIADGKEVDTKRMILTE